jgi:UDPglucose--hexose-1-phosphate uridylyltransferase
VSPQLAATVIRLADGRQLVYYDEPGAPPRETHDRRTLENVEHQLELRLDPLRDEWVIVASHRQGRTHLPSRADCPLCPSTPERPTEIPASDYDVVVFENRFPSLATGIAPPPDFAGAPGLGAAAGRCEVVCFTSRHDGSFAGLAPGRVRTIVEVWAERTTTLGLLAAVEQVFPFENSGEEIGVTLAHPHGQIYAYPFVTPRTRRMLDEARRHEHEHGTNLFADVLARERSAGTRVVVETELWTAFVPAFARWPFELHVYPNRQVPDLPALTGRERDDLAGVLLDVHGRFARVFDRPLPYIAAWHQAPVRVDRELACLHLQLFSIRRAPGKLKYLAASESAMDVFINDVRPEEAAALLRDAGPRAGTGESVLQRSAPERRSS